MAKLHRRIEEQSERARIETMEEWKVLSKRYEDLSLQLAQSTCTCGTQKRSTSCTKYKIKRQRKKIKVKIHEDFLPKDQAQSKTVVFELQCPQIFAAYRNAAWSILSYLGYPNLTAPSEKTYDIRDYKSLAPFRTGSPSNITLASKIKSHLRSHYKLSSVPARIEGVLRPHGLMYSYSDATTRVCSPLAQLKTLPGFSVGDEGPSSNAILASQPLCPRGVSVHEFAAAQTLFSGRRTRWPAILVELGSSNLNFSSEAISLVVSQLAAHAGPGEPGGGDALRTAHSIFRDDAFCAQLAEQIGQRLNLIAAN
ncbi:hypothetical protein BKCO1_7800036 [Neofusicoccum parvum]|uniref:Uncharacterized protein n=1 Tax=Neofusicoccum parvum TaxID=310453 RepID=A0ACB5SBP6_9PEZI|nr:hypothetical protein BKCO1_7800036 [Neofusicoccum parvum]